MLLNNAAPVPGTPGGRTSAGGANTTMFSNRPPHSGHCFPAWFLSGQQLFHQSISDRGQNVFFKSISRLSNWIKIPGQAFHKKKRKKYNQEQGVNKAKEIINSWKYSSKTWERHAGVSRSYQALGSAPVTHSGQTRKIMYMFAQWLVYIFSICIQYIYAKCMCYI